MDKQKVLWRIVGGLSGFAAGAATRSVMRVGWRRVRGTEPPTNPAAPSTSWSEALAWAVATGVGLSVARLVSRRAAAGAWRAAAGSYPPDLEAVA